MQTKFIFILLQLYCLLVYTNGHLSYKYKSRNRSRGSVHNTHNAQALVLAESTSSSSTNQLSTNNNHHQSQIECDFLNHKETGCEDEIGSRCDPNTSKCVCKDSHPVRLLDFCLKISRLNGPCYTSGQCAVVANASCYIFGKEYDLETSSGGHNLGRLVKNWPLGICKCRLGFAYNLTTNACEKRIIGSWCSHDKHCLLRSLNSICDKKRGECECAWGTRYESKLDSCVPDTSPTNALGSLNGVGGHSISYGSNRQVYYMSKCEKDSDCSLSSTSPQQTQISSSSSSSGISSTSSSSISEPTVSSAISSSSPQPSIIQSSTSSSALNSNHHPSTVQIENNNLMLEQADQENQFNQIRYLHGHRRLKDNLKRLTNYHLRELQCVRGRCVCSSLHLWDGATHCKEPYDTQSPYNSSTHRHNRKNHNSFNDLDDELNDEFDDDSSINWQTIFLMSIGSSLFAGFIFRYCYYRKGEDDDELSEGLRSPDGLYAHKAALGRKHPFNPVTVAFLSKPAINGSSCSNHFSPSYGYMASSAAPACYHHEFDYGYDGYPMCNGSAPPPHPMNSAQMRDHMANNSLGKPPNEADEDAYLEQNPEERENFEKKDEDNLNHSKYGCVQCGRMRNDLQASINHSVTDIQPNSQWCGCEFTNLNTKDGKPSIDPTLTRAILEQYGSASLAGDSLNSNVGIRDVVDCVTPATATTTCGRTSSGNTTNNEEDDDEHKSSANESSNLENDLKEGHLTNLLSQATSNLHTSFIKQVDLGSDEDLNEETSDEHIAILSCKTRKEQIKKWRSSSSSAETTTTSISNPSSSLLSTNSSPNKNNKLLIDSQPEQFQIA